MPSPSSESVFVPVLALHLQKQIRQEDQTITADVRKHYQKMAMYIGPSDNASDLCMVGAQFENR
jgi:hypothetical protein